MTSFAGAIATNSCSLFPVRLLIKNLFLSKTIIMFVLVLFIVVLIGAANWLCIGLFQFDIIAGLFGNQSTFISRFFYSLIGLCGILLLLIALFKRFVLDMRGNKCKRCPNCPPKPDKQKPDNSPSPKGWQAEPDGVAAEGANAEEAEVAEQLTPEPKPEPVPPKPKRQYKKRTAKPPQADTVPE